jgi:cytochrome c oxidase cbb3-type subunit 4
MEYETLMTIQGYAKFALVLLVFIVFYSYAYSIYKRQKTGERDFEKYSNLVLDDSIESKPLEEREKDKENDIKKDDDKKS